MKMIAGAFLRACSNRSRTRAAPTPTNISTNSEPLIEKNGTPASPATALRQQRLAGSRRADQQDAARHARAQPAVFFRVLEEIDDLLQLRLGLVDAGDVVERRLGVGLDIDLGLAAADRHQPAEARPGCSPRGGTRTAIVPKNTSVGSTQDSSVLSQLFWTWPLKRT